MDDKKVKQGKSSAHALAVWRGGAKWDGQGLLEKKAWEVIFVLKYGVKEPCPTGDDEAEQETHSAYGKHWPCGVSRVFEQLRPLMRSPDTVNMSAEYCMEWQEAARVLLLAVAHATDRDEWSVWK